MRDTFNRMIGRRRYVVFRIFLHLGGGEVTPILGVLNNAGRDAINADGDLEVLGEGLVEISQTLLQYNEYWLSAANEGDVFWDEGEAGDYVNELFTDSAQRYLSYPDLVSFSESISGAVSQNLIVMITVAYEGEVPDLETDLSYISALKKGLKTLINLHYKHRFRAIQVHFSPAKISDELTNEQLLQYYPELMPLDRPANFEELLQYYPELKFLADKIPTETSNEPIKVFSSHIPINNEAIEVFFSYALEDENLRKQLANHLSLLKRLGIIKDWYEGEIHAGAERVSEIEEHLNTARIILLLISADFLASDDCYRTIEQAMQRHKTGEARVIPVILRPVDWKGAVFSNLKPLPEDGNPITQWKNRDAAFANVATGIRKVVEELASKNS